MSNLPNCWIIDAVRTPTGKRNGSLSGYHPAELGGLVVDALLERTQINTSTLPIEDVIIGCVSQVGAQSSNIARGIVLSSSLPLTVPATTVDRQCGSSLQALTAAADRVWAGSHCVLAGGVEVMSAVPLGSAYDLQTVAPRPNRPAKAADAKDKPNSNTLKPTATSANTSTTASVQASPPKQQQQQQQLLALPRHALGVPLPPSVLRRLPMPDPRAMPRLPVLAHHHPFSIRSLYPHAAQAAEVVAEAARTAADASGIRENGKIGKKFLGGDWFYSFDVKCPYHYVASAENGKASNPFLPPLSAYSPENQKSGSSSPKYLPPAGAHSQFVGADVISRKYGLCLCSIIEYSRLSWYRSNLIAQRLKKAQSGHGSLTKTARKCARYGEELVPVPVRSKADATAPTQRPAVATQRPSAGVEMLTPPASSPVSTVLSDADVLRLARAGAYGDEPAATATAAATPSATSRASKCDGSCPLPGAPSQTPLLTADETLRPVPTLAALLAQSTDKPIPPTSWVTAPLASQVSDGASMAMVCSDHGLKALGCDVKQRAPLGRIVAVAVAAGDPVCMLDQVAAAVLLAIQRANARLQQEWTLRNANGAADSTPFQPLTASDPRIVYELNEAFASVPLAAARALGLRPDRLNVEGGAIALGHPLGATGVKLVASGCRTAQRLGCKYLCVGVCEGGGMANAMVVEVAGVRDDDWVVAEQEEQTMQAAEREAVTSKL